MKLDLHVRPACSYDSRSSPESIVEKARRLGLDGVVITELNSCRASAEWDRAGHQGLLVLHGVSSGGRTLTSTAASGGFTRYSRIGLRAWSS
jgi:predicted metal-dependent phosphoesterase TrpH